jgi:hypothetical protein
VFCHAFKEWPSFKRFRLAYKIIDPAAGKYASVYQSSIRSMADGGISSNTPHCLAASLALRDPFLDKMPSGTIICLFNNHKIIHDRVHSYLTTNKLRQPLNSFDKYINNLCKLLDPTKTATRWNNIKDPSNRLADVLKDVGDFQDEEETLGNDVFCDASILRATEGAAHEMMSEYYEHIMRRKNSESIFDDLPF